MKLCPSAQALTQGSSQGITLTLSREGDCAQLVLSLSKILTATINDSVVFVADLTSQLRACACDLLSSRRPAIVQVCGDGVWVSFLFVWPASSTLVGGARLPSTA